MKSAPVITFKPDGTIKADRMYLTVDEAAHILGMSPKGLRNKLAPSAARPLDPRIKRIRIGRSIRFRLDDILKISSEDVMADANEGGADERSGSVPDLPEKAKARQ